MAKQYTKEELMAWADAHFPKVREDADDTVFERELREICVLGSAYNEKLAVGANRIFHCMKSPNRYFVYFQRRAKLDKIGSEKFKGMAERGGVRFTNEYLYTTRLRGSVDAAVVEACERLVAVYQR